MFGKLISAAIAVGTAIVGVKIVKDILEADEEEKKIIELDTEEEKVEVEE